MPGFEQADERVIMPLVEQARTAMKPQDFAAAETAGLALRRHDVYSEVRTWLESLA